MDGAEKREQWKKERSNDHKNDQSPRVPRTGNSFYLSDSTFDFPHPLLALHHQQSSTALFDCCHYYLFSFFIGCVPKIATFVHAVDGIVNSRATSSAALGMSRRQARESREQKASNKLNNCKDKSLEKLERQRTMANERLSPLGRMSPTPSTND